MEMTVYQQYDEVLDILEALFANMFDRLKTEYERELNIIQQQYPFTPLEYNSIPRIEWRDAVQLLRSELRKPIEQTVNPGLVWQPTMLAPSYPVSD